MSFQGLVHVAHILNIESQPGGGWWFHRFLGGGFKHFLFSPLPGEIIQFD